METRVLPFSAETIAEATRLVLAGEPVAVPTETVYGLAADATNAAAVARIYEAKGRPGFNPLIVHVADLAAAERIGDFIEEARRLVEQHWPGPLTLVVKLREQTTIASIVTAGLQTVGLRVPSHPAMQALLRAVGRPLAAPSANASGSMSPTRAEHVLTSLGGRIPLIIDGGATQRGLESTIVAATGGKLRLLRPGPIIVEAEHASDDDHSADDLDEPQLHGLTDDGSPGIGAPPVPGAPELMSSASRAEWSLSPPSRHAW